MKPRSFNSRKIERNFWIGFFLTLIVAGILIYLALSGTIIHIKELEPLDRFLEQFKRPFTIRIGNIILRFI